MQKENPSSLLSAEDKVIINTLIFGAILPLLDTSVVNVALHDIGSQFGASLGLSQWTITSYTLAAAGAVPLSGWLTQKIGSKRLWITSLWVFLFGSLFSGLAWNIETLIFSRVLQGVACGVLLPTMQTIVIEAIGKKKAKSALTAMAIPSVIAPILGPVIAGALLRFADWRMIFWLHVPICAVAIYLGWRNIPKDSRENFIAGFDIIGFLFLCPGMILSIYGIDSINPSSPADMNTGIAVASVGIVFLASFFLISKRKPDSSLIDISMFKHSNFRKASLLLFTSSAVYYGGIMLYPLYFIQHDGYPSYLAGILLGVHGIGTLLSRWKLDRISRAVGEERTTVLAVILTIMGSCIVGWHGELGNTWVLGFGMLLRGAGIGVLTIISMAGAYVGLTDRQISHASSVTRMMTHLGATIGVTGVTIAIKISSDGYLFSGSVFDAGHVFLLALSTLCFFMINRQKK